MTFLMQKDQTVEAFSLRASRVTVPPVLEPSMSGADGSLESLTEHVDGDLSQARALAEKHADSPTALARLAASELSFGNRVSAGQAARRVLDSRVVDPPALLVASNIFTALGDISSVRACAGEGDHSNGTRGWGQARSGDPFGPCGSAQRRHGKGTAGLGALRRCRRALTQGRAAGTRGPVPRCNSGAPRGAARHSRRSRRLVQPRIRLCRCWLWPQGCTRDQGRSGSGPDRPHSRTEPRRIAALRGQSA